MEDNKVEIIIKAIDEVSATTKEIENKIAGMSKQIETSSKNMVNSFQKGIGSLIAIGNAAASVERIFSSYQNLQLRLENAAIRVEEAQKNQRDAQYNLNKVMRDGTSTAEDIAKAKDDLDTATNRVTVALNNEKRAHGQILGTYIQMGVQVAVLVASLPALWTGIVGLTTAAWASVPALGGMAAGFLSISIAGAPLWIVLTAIIAAVAAVAAGIAYLVNKFGGKKIAPFDTDNAEQYKTSLPEIKTEVIDLSSNVKNLSSEYDNLGYYLDNIKAKTEPAKTAYQALSDKIDEQKNAIYNLMLIRGENTVLTSLEREELKKLQDALAATVSKYDAVTNAANRAADARSRRFDIGGSGGGGYYQGVKIQEQDSSGNWHGVGDWASKGVMKVNDFMIAPGGQPMQINPNDTIIGFKGRNPMAGGMNITITGNNIYGVDADNIADAIQKKLTNMISVC